MPSLTIERTIAAPIEKVFRTVAHIEEFSKAIPHIVNVEILSDVKTGVGTRFRETRLLKGEEAQADLEVTEYAENDRIRLVADSHDTVWDTVFTVREQGAATELTMVMEAKPQGLLAKLAAPMMMGMVKKLVEADMDSVKAHCEG